MTENKKYRESETVSIPRSRLNFAPYNPKQHTKEQINEIKKNVTRVGLLGGIVWNKRTGNIIDGHKRIMALDLIHKYDGKKNDYDIKVEMIDLDEKTEKEQNIFQSQSRTPIDMELVAIIMPDVDYQNTGLTDMELDLIGYPPRVPEEEIKRPVAPDFIDFGNDNEEAGDDTGFEFMEDEDDRELSYDEVSEEEKAERRQAVKGHKERIIEERYGRDKGALSYVTLMFNNAEEARTFSFKFGYDASEQFLDGNEFMDKVELIG